MKLDSVRELKQSIVHRMETQAPAILASRAGWLHAVAPRAVVALDTPPFLALGVSPGNVNGYRLAVRVQTRAPEARRELQRIERQAKGELDVRYVGRITTRAAGWPRQRLRPLAIGSSIGHHKITAGTLGCFVAPSGGGAPLILSNNHVLANENKAKKGDAILQPGPLDGGEVPTDAVAALERFVRLSKRRTNLMDCAMATPLAGVEMNPAKVKGLGRLAGLGAEFIDEGAKVAKIGRTTGLTRGRVSAFELDNVVVGYAMGNLRFDNQVEIEGEGTQPFSDGGDSGSLILNEERLAVALLFAGSDQGGAEGQGLTFANPLRAVLAALNVRLFTG